MKEFNTDLGFWSRAGFYDKKQHLASCDETHSVHAALY